MIKKQYLFSILAIMVLALLFVSCTIDRQPNDNVPNTTPSPTSDTRQTRVVPDDNTRNTPLGSPSPNPNNEATPRRITGTDDNNNNNITDNRTNNQNNNIGNNDNDMQQQAERIADAVTKKKEIESATCVITGNTAMVGVQFNEQYKGELTDKIKKSVEKTAKDADDSINRVVVTADPDIVSRLEEMFEDIGDGKPLSGFTEELNEIMNRIQPR